MRLSTCLDISPAVARTRYERTVAAYWHHRPRALRSAAQRRDARAHVAEPESFVARRIATEQPQVREDLASS